MGLRLGQRIGIAWLQHVDGICQFCRRGRENLCRDSRYTGYDVDGGYAEYAVVPEDFAYELPEDLDDEHISPLLCAGLIGYRALQRAAVPEKGRLLLVGFGSSAHIVIQIALHRGHEIWVVTRSENHIRQARELGAAWARARKIGFGGRSISKWPLPIGELPPSLSDTNLGPIPGAGFIVCFRGEPIAAPRTARRMFLVRYVCALLSGETYECTRLWSESRRY